MAYAMTVMSSVDIVALAKSYPLDISIEARANVAEIRISGAIHRWENSAAQFKGKIDALLAQGIKDVDLYINTPGGSVFEANEIANEIRRFPGKIVGKGGAVVASAGSYLALVCESFEMAANGQYMYHKPRGVVEGNEDSVESGLQLLKNLTSQYRTAYAKKTGMSEDDIEARWAKGDVWLTAEEARKQKFITSVAAEEPVTEEQRAMFVAFGVPQYELQVNSKPENSMKNRNELIAKLKLPADATDEQILAAADAAVNAANDAKTIVAQAKEDQKRRLEAAIDKAVLEKRTTADLKERYMTLGQVDFEGTMAVIEGLSPVSKPEINPGASANGENRANWTMEDYQEKDPEALAEMMAKNPEAFKKLEDAYFGK